MTSADLPAILRQFTRRYRLALVAKAGILAALSVACAGVAAARLRAAGVDPIWSCWLPGGLALAALAGLGWWFTHRWISGRDSAAWLDRTLELEERLITAAEFSTRRTSAALYPLLLEDTLRRYRAGSVRFPKPLGRLTAALGLLLLLLAVWPLRWRVGASGQRLASLPASALQALTAPSPDAAAPTTGDQPARGGSPSRRSPQRGSPPQTPGAGGAASPEAPAASSASGSSDQAAPPGGGSAIGGSGPQTAGQPQEGTDGAGDAKAAHGAGGAGSDSRQGAAAARGVDAARGASSDDRQGAGSARDGSRASSSSSSDMTAQAGSGMAQQDIGSRRPGGEPSSSRSVPRGEESPSRSGDQRAASSSTQTAPQDAEGRGAADGRDDAGRRAQEPSQRQEATRASQRQASSDRLGQEGTRRSDAQDERGAAATGSRGRQQATERESQQLTGVARQSEGRDGGASTGEGQAVLREDIQTLLKQVSGELQQLQAQLAAAQDAPPPQPGTSTDPQLYESAMSPSERRGGVEGALPIQLSTDAAPTSARRRGSSSSAEPAADVASADPTAQPEAASLSEVPLDEPAAARQPVPLEYQDAFNRLGSRQPGASTPP
jgi:hypothetical protein